MAQGAGAMPGDVAMVSGLSSCASVSTGSDAGSDDACQHPRAKQQEQPYDQSLQQQQHAAELLAALSERFVVHAPPANPGERTMTKKRRRNM